MMNMQCFMYCCRLQPASVYMQYIIYIYIYLHVCGPYINDLNLNAYRFNFIIRIVIKFSNCNVTMNIIEKKLKNSYLYENKTY